jgi:peptide deformylase
MKTLYVRRINMALREVRVVPDPVLRKRSREITEITSRIKTLAVDMVDTMRKEDGVGLAAPQIGILKRIVVIEIEDKLYQMINPEILEFSGEEIDFEGCLSVPNRQGRVKRPTWLKVRYTNLDGEITELEAEDFLARAVCHELDHLEGVLYIDKLEPDEENNN